MATVLVIGIDPVKSELIVVNCVGNCTNTVPVAPGALGVASVAVVGMSPE